MGFNSGFKGLKLTSNKNVRYEVGLSGSQGGLLSWRFPNLRDSLICLTVSASGCSPVSSQICDVYKLPYIYKRPVIIACTSARYVLELWVQE